MLKNLRQSLAAVGGVQVVVALSAIAWGIATLQKVAEERQAHLELLAEAAAEQEAALLELARQRHPAGSARPAGHAYEECDTRTHPECYPADYVAEKHSREDVDPLGRGEADRG